MYFKHFIFNLFRQNSIEFQYHRFILRWPVDWWWWPTADGLCSSSTRRPALVSRHIYWNCLGLRYRSPQAPAVESGRVITNTIIIIIVICVEAITEAISKLLYMAITFKAQLVINSSALNVNVLIIT